MASCRDGTNPYQIGRCIDGSRRQNSAQFVDHARSDLRATDIDAEDYQTAPPPVARISGRNWLPIML